MVKVTLKGGGWKKEERLGFRGMGAAEFCGLYAYRLYFCCCSGGYLCQGLQGAGDVYTWYNSLVCG
jgi:hypothetical protein